jgi:hypothetical protein
VSEHSVVHFEAGAARRVRRAQPLSWLQWPPRASRRAGPERRKRAGRSNDQKCVMFRIARIPQPDNEQRRPSRPKWDPVAYLPVRDGAAKRGRVGGCPSGCSSLKVNAIGLSVSGWGRTAPTAYACRAPVSRGGTKGAPCVHAWHLRHAGRAWLLGASVPMRKMGPPGFEPGTDGL